MGTATARSRSVVDSHNPAVVVQATIDVEVWRDPFVTAVARIADRFGRVEPRRQARSFLLGSLSDVDTRSCWQLAEQAGDASPHTMQRASARTPRCNWRRISTRSFGAASYPIVGRRSAECS